MAENLYTVGFFKELPGKNRSPATVTAASWYHICISFVGVYKGNKKTDREKHKEKHILTACRRIKTIKPFKGGKNHG
jgi:hypothetical protein